MATFTFNSTGAETYNGSGESDLFIGSNNFFGAGDRAFGMGGVDEFLYFADPSLTVDAVAKANPFGAATTKTFAAFQLSDVEVVTITNDSGSALIFDMSSSAGVTDLVSANSSDAVIFDQVTNLANIRLNTLTFVGTADVAVGFQAAALAGATTVNLVLQNTAGDAVRIGGVGGTLGNTGNTGVETVNLTVLDGTSSINTLDTMLTNLVILDVPGSAWGVTITNTLAGTVRVVDNQSDGNATVDASAATGSVAFTGVGGSETYTGGAFSDTFNLGNGNNTAMTGGGNNTVNTGSGTDTVFAQGGTDTVNTGAGNDSIVDTTGTRLVLNAGDGSDSYIGIGGNFNASNGAGFDSLNMGAGFDVVFVDAGTTDAMYFQAMSTEGVAIVTAGTTTLGANAQASGVNSIFLGSGSAGNDVVNAGTFTTGLSVTSSGSDSAADGATLATQAGRIARFSGIDSTGGGNDTVTTGSAVDYFLFRGDAALTQDDQLMAGGQTNAGGAVVGDTLVLEGDTTLGGAGVTNGFNGFEFVALESAVGSAYRTQAPGGGFGNQYNLTITDANAPSTGALFINGSNLKGAAAGVNADEWVVVNASTVTAFALDITTGGGSDTIVLGGAGAMAARVVTQGGADTVVESAGNTANDIIDTGLGGDTVVLVGGNNTVFDEGGNNIIVLGAGNDTVFTGTGNDLIQAFGGVLNGMDNLADAGGYDAIYINTAATDAMFAGVNAGGAANSRYEVLFVDGAVTVTLGANAARAGFTTLVGNSADQTFNINNASFNKGMLVDLSAGGNDVVNLGSPTALAAPSVNAPTPAGFFDFIGPVPGYSWAPVGGFPAAPDTTANANLVIAGTGNQTINGGSGSDVVRVDGTEWDGADVFAGAAGYDAVQFDNTAGGVTATVNLTNVTNTELFQTLAGGDRLAGVDADLNTINFTGGAVGTLTRLKVDNSALNDAADTTRVVLQAGLTDADYAFNIFGAQAGTTFVDKQNNGVNNNINFQGGAGVDILSITGGDLGSTTVFNGAGGSQDAIIQTGGVISDDSYTSVDAVEILTALPGVLNATLGAQAAGSGLTTIQGTTGNDNVLLDAAFTSNLLITLGGGNDNFNAASAAGTMTFNETLTNVTAADTVVGGANGADVFNVDATGGGAADLTNVWGIENYNFTANGGDMIDLTLGAGPVNGGQTINILSAGGGTNIATTIHGAAATVNTTVNSIGGNDAITLGSGNDIINSGSGNDSLYGNGGTDTLNAGAGNDELTGGNGADTMVGGDGTDMLRGQAGNDTMDGGAGSDVLYGGAGADFLSGGADADVYLYDGTTTGDSPFAGRDTVVVGNGDTFDFGIPVTFQGSQANFGDAQSSISAGGAIEAVFQSDTNVLWVDVNNDGALNNNDLQILIQFTDGLTALTGANFPATALTVAGFDASFAPAV